MTQEVEMVLKAVKRDKHGWIDGFTWMGETDEFSAEPLFIEKPKDWEIYMSSKLPSLRFHTPFGEPTHSPTFALVVSYLTKGEWKWVVLTDVSVYVESDRGDTIECLCNRDGINPPE